MAHSYNFLFAGMWLAWAIYWLALSVRVKPTARQESVFSRLSYVLPLLVAGVLVFAPRLSIPVLDARFLPVAGWRVWVGIGAALNLAGLLFTVWARTHLGRNWSGVVTVKEGHELVMSGPYRWVRHPIYTGLVLAFAGLAIARGEWRGVVALLIVTGAFWRKLRIEEQWMLEQFGDQYRNYSQRVAALIPCMLRRSSRSSQVKS
ncbi:MAG: methyltransferase family protein [Steroidobacteraceae bacterium]